MSEDRQSASIAKIGRRTATEKLSEESKERYREATEDIKKRERHSEKQM